MAHPFWLTFPDLTRVGAGSPTGSLAGRKVFSPAERPCPCPPLSLHQPQDWSCLMQDWGVIVSPHFLVQEVHFAFVTQLAIYSGVCCAKCIQSQ